MGVGTVYLTAPTLTGSMFMRGFAFSMASWIIWGKDKILKESRTFVRRDNYYLCGADLYGVLPLFGRLVVLAQLNFLDVAVDLNDDLK